jgi:hypothetical protein
MITIVDLIARMDEYEKFIGAVRFGWSEAEMIAERELRLNPDACLLGIVLIHLNAQEEQMESNHYRS